MIKVGDKVVLNSGGPVMKVTETLSGGRLVCIWDTLGGSMARVFDERCVQKVEIADEEKRGRAAASSSPS